MAEVEAVVVGEVMMVVAETTMYCTVGQIRRKHRINSRLINHCATSEGVSERTSERSGERERSE